MKNKAALTNIEAVAATAGVIPLLDQEEVFHSNHF